MLNNTRNIIFYCYDTVGRNGTINSLDSRYKSTAKELDNELRSNRRTPLKIINSVRQTNYTYFGARYYDSEASIWLSVYTERVSALSVLACRSVDPLADARSCVSP